MEFVTRFRDLKVYQLSTQLSKEIFELTKKFPKEETYSLTDQIRRSSRSIGAQIAEAWAKRRYERYFISKLTDACGELFETEHWLETAENSLYISSDVSRRLIAEYLTLEKMLNSMINKSTFFCKAFEGDQRNSDI
jgi:four helix bundle protein